MRYVSSFFDQSGDAVDYISEHGAKAWLDSLSGSLDVLDGETWDSPPWGESDALEYVESVGDYGCEIFIHVNYAMGYASVTTSVH